MPNSFKFNSSTTEPLSLRKGNIYIGVGDVGKGPTSLTGFKGSPSFGTASTLIGLHRGDGVFSWYRNFSDSELISRTNRIDTSEARTTKEQCFSYFAGQPDKIVLNREYESIVTDGLVLNLDAGFLPSYPETGSTWYDLNILGRTYSIGTNQTYNSSGYFDMPGNTSLQGINCTNLTLTNNSCTLIFWIRTTDTQSLFWGAGGGGAYYVGAYSVNNKEYYSNAGSPDYFQDLIEKNNIYDHLPDGRWHMCEFKNVNFSNWTNQHNFNSYDGFLFNTNSSVSKILIYNRSITTNESISLYYGGSVVTSGLLFSFDSANLISYPSSGTTCYSLTGSNTLTLVNGVGFDKKYGGRWILDGNNDRLDSNFTDTIDSVTIECWYRGTKTSRNHLWNFGVYPTTNFHCNFNDSPIPLWFYWNSNGGNLLWFEQGNFTDGTIKHLVFTHNGSDNQAYLNGQLLTAGRHTQGTQTFTDVNSGGSFNVGGDPNFGGDIYQVRIYNRALSSSEILQNFNAHKSRYGL